MNAAPNLSSVKAACRPFRAILPSAVAMLAQLAATDPSSSPALDLAHCCLRLHPSFPTSLVVISRHPWECGGYSLVEVIGGGCSLLRSPMRRLRAGILRRVLAVRHCLAWVLRVSVGACAGTRQTNAIVAAAVYATPAIVGRHCCCRPDGMRMIG